MGEGMGGGGGGEVGMGEGVGGGGDSVGVGGVASCGSDTAAVLLSGAADGRNRELLLGIQCPDFAMLGTFYVNNNM